MASRRRRRRRGLGPPSSSDNLDEAFERGEEEPQTFDPTVEIEEPRCIHLMAILLELQTW